MNLSEFSPPIVTRAIKGVMRGIRGQPTSLDVRGRRFMHRGTVADNGVVEQIFLHRDYDFSRLRRNPEILQFYAACERPLIVDAGANIGASAVWFATEFPKATVVAVEPASNNFSFIEKNVAGLNVRPVLGALAGKPGRLRLFDPGEGEWGYRTGQTGPGGLADVRAYSIDELITSEDTPFVLKIDIEGAEADVFENNPEAASRFPVVVIELHDWMLPRSGSSQAFLRWHSSLDRDFVYLRENVFSLCNRQLPKIGK